MKSIPAALVTHKAQPATTLCYIQRVGPLPDASYLAFTSLDRDVVADPDGTGALTYRAATGMQMSELSSTHGLEVDNGESQSLAPVYPITGITEAMVDDGDLDGVEFTIWQINYDDPSDGAEVMASGVIGEVRILDGGLITWENRSWSQRLKQNSICERDSLTCRVKRFGSQDGDERFPCKYDWSEETVPGEPWTLGTVTSVGTETVRDFTAAALGGAGVASIAVTAGGSGYTSPPTVVLTGGSGSGATATAVLTGDAVTSITVNTPGSQYLTAPTVSLTGGGGTGATADATLETAIHPADYFAPGLVEWLTGDNAGMSREVESFTAAAVISLAFTTRHPIAVGDTFQIRRDCTRQWSGHNSCATYANRPNFRGEPFIPVSETIGLTVPGAATGSGFSSTDGTALE